MKLHFSNDWIRQTIAADPDSDPEAGPTVGPPSAIASAPTARDKNLAVLGEHNVLQIRMALGVLMRQLRFSRGLSIAELAERAQVAEDELRQVERDPHYTALPRLIFQLSEYFAVSFSALSQVAGTTQEVDQVLYNEAVKYAAHSDEAAALTHEQRTALDVFVSLVNERAKA